MYPESSNNKNSTAIVIKKYFQVWLGFVLCHFTLITIYVSALMLKQYGFIYGTRINTPTEIVVGISRVIYYYGLVQFIPFSFLFALLLSLVYSMCGEWRRVSSKSNFYWTHLLFGAFAYMLLSMILWMWYPGSLGTTPVLKYIPYWVLYIFLFTVIVLILCFVARRPIQAVMFCSVCILPVIIPHHAIRDGVNYFRYSDQDHIRKRYLFFVLDSARFDDVEKSWDIPNTPVYKGISHFQSTRKQWLLMLGKDPKDVSDKFFLPLKAEYTNGSNTPPFPLSVPGEHYRASFLLDNGGTAGSNSLNLHLSELLVNDTDIDASAFPEFIPIAPWLNNYLSVVESSNNFSNIQSFLHDTSKSLERNDLVLAHTCYLEHSLSSVPEFFRFMGVNWLCQSPNYFIFDKPLNRKTSGLSPKMVAAFKTTEFLKLFKENNKEWEKSFPDLSGIFTSDHGQYFETYQGLTLCPSHGFFSSPDCAWIPIIPIGSSRIQTSPDNIPFTWLDIRQALNSSLKNQTSVVLKNNGYPIQSSFYYIAPTFGKDVTTSPYTLNISKLVLLMGFNHQLGLYLDESITRQRYDKSFTFYSVTEGLITANPASQDTYRVQVWDGYHLKRETVVPKSKLRETLELLGYS